MVSSLNILLAVASLASVAANSLDSFSFVESKVASAYEGTPLDVKFRTVPSALRDYDAVAAMKPIVRRLGENAITFTPSHRVVPGHMAPFSCRRDNLVVNPIPDRCLYSCQNRGRYCTFRSELPTSRQNPEVEHILGRDLVAESARRTCFFQLHGAPLYFMYMDAMHATGCYTSLSQACLDEVYVSLEVDASEVTSCMGVMEPTREDKNQLLERLMEDGVGIDGEVEVPDFSINGKSPDLEIPAEGFDTEFALKAVCDAFPSGNKPKVCDFCIHYCPNMDGRLVDVPQCLWNLRCNDANHTSFDDYLVSIGEEPEVAVPEVAATTTSTTVSSVNEHTVEKDISFAMIFLFAALFLTALALTFMVAVRSYRNKRIIGQYLQEQSEQERMHTEGGAGVAGGVHHHLDPSFFPEDIDLDLDVEPQLQYRDHINPAPPQQPPSQHSFLPRIS